MGEESPARRPRAPAIVALLLLAGLAGLAAFAVAQRAPLAGRLARALLAKRGVEASLTVTRLGWRGAQLEDLRVGAPDTPALTARRVELAWSLAGLRAGRLDRIAAEGARLDASLDAEGIRLRGLAAPRGGGDAATSLPLAAPFEAVELRDAELRLETPAGAVALSGGGEARLAADRISGSFRLDGATPYGGIETTLDLAGTAEDPLVGFDATARPEPGALPLRFDSALAAKGTLRRDPDGAPRVELALALPWLELAGRARLEQVALEAAGGAEELHVKIRIARLVDRGEPALVAPLAVDAELHGSLERLELTGVARPDGDALRGELRGVIEPLARRAEIGLHVPETELADAAREPARLFPFLAGRIERARGRVGVEGRLHLEGGALRASADLALRDVDLRTPDLALRRVNGVVRVEGPPLRTPPRQLVAVAAIEGALPLADGLVSFELARADLLRVESASFAFAGGRLRASGELALGATERRLALAAEGLDVETLLASLGFEGLSGTGTLEGTLPLRQRGSRLSIDTGRLRATAPGVLRYRARAGPAAAEWDEKVGVVLGALEDLHYDELSLEISGDTGDELSVKIHARGRNPGYQEGRPVVLNLDVQARLSDLVRAGQAAYRVPAEVEERLERSLGPERR